MKRYKLNVFDNNHRFGFVFASKEMLTSRLDRVMEKVQSMNRTLHIVECDSELELEMRIIVK